MAVSVNGEWFVFFSSKFINVKKSILRMFIHSLHFLRYQILARNVWEREQRQKSLTKKMDSTNSQIKHFTDDGNGNYNYTGIKHTVFLALLV